MQANEWLKTVEAFFREKNRAWLQENEETLLHYLAGTPHDCHSWQDVRAMREAIKHRGVRYRKAKTHLQILSSTWNEAQEQAVVQAVEHVRFYYEQKDDLQHESRKIDHKLTLMPFGGAWRLIADESNRESAAFAPRVSEEEQEFDREEQLQARPFRGRYDRVRAYKYSELWWDSYNPAFQVMKGNDCTNYISQVLYAGGMPMVGGKSRSQGWWYRASGRTHSWSYSWAVAHSLRLALPRDLHAQQVSDPRMLKIGDIICYDWDGDGRWQHNTVVVDFDYYGRPLVNAHTIASHRRYWDYRDSYAFTPRTQYLFFHIPDSF